MGNGFAHDSVHRGSAGWLLAILLLLVPYRGDVQSDRTASSCAAPAAASTGFVALAEGKRVAVHGGTDARMAWPFCDAGSLATELAGGLRSAPHLGPSAAGTAAVGLRLQPPTRAPPVSR